MSSVRWILLPFLFSLRILGSGCCSEDCKGTLTCPRDQTDVRWQSAGSVGSGLSSLDTDSSCLPLTFLSCSSSKMQTYKVILMVNECLCMFDFYDTALKKAVVKIDI